jgi:hypothetical protein
MDGVLSCIPCFIGGPVMNFLLFFTGVDEPAVSVSFVLLLNKGMAEMHAEPALQRQRKTQHQKEYGRPAGLRPLH